LTTGDPVKTILKASNKGKNKTIKRGKSQRDGRLNEHLLNASKSLARFVVNENNNDRK